MHVMIHVQNNPATAHARAQESNALLLDKESACTAAAAEVAGTARRYQWFVHRGS
jgi:hypothetical protein